MFKYRQKLVFLTKFKLLKEDKMSNQQKTVVVLLIVLILLSVGGIFLGASFADYKAVNMSGNVDVSGESSSSLMLEVQNPLTGGANG